MKKRFLACFAAALLLIGILTGCGKKEDPFADESTFTDHTIVITLYPEVAPITCENFENLVNEGFYNGVGFHRVIDDFVAQGGDPTGTGMGGSATRIKGEFEANGVKNDLSHQRGIVSMARSQDMDSASSQFFICYTDCSGDLDGKYAAFGEVTYGMEVVDNFLKVERVISGGKKPSDPTSPITMEKVAMIGKDDKGHPRVRIEMNDFLK